MATAVIMPRQGQSVESCLIGEWRKKPGDSVKAGEVLFSYETDKAVFEEEAKVDGVLLAVLCEEGDDVPCLSTVAVIGAEGEDVSGFTAQRSAQDGEPAAEEVPSSLAAAAPAPVSEAPAAGGAASPRARAAAERMNVDLSRAAPSGPHGRIIERDVLKAPRTAPEVQDAPAPAESAGYHDEKLSNIRRRIAASMKASLSESAQLTHQVSFDASAVIAYRGRLKASMELLQLPNITYNDMILFAVSRVLKRHPYLNAHFLEDRVRVFDHVHLGMAVDTPRGLIVPTIFNADRKTLGEIAAESKTLAAAAQSGSIDPDLLSGASFTVSNLGSMGIEMFTPVINPPQTGILGVDCMQDRIRIIDGQITAYPAMGLSLTYDHRALDGGPASRFLMDLKNAMERFTELMAQ